MTSTADAQLYIRVLENVDEAVAAIDREGRVVLFNPAAQAFFGLSERQSLGRPYEALFAGQEQLIRLVRSAITSVRSISDHENVQLVRPGSAPLPVSVTVSPILTGDAEPEGVAVILRDLSRMRELEATVRRADRLSMLGTLAAGLAHEIKNPLGGIKGAAQLLDLEIAGGSPLHDYTKVVIREVERINGIIEELLDLANPRPPQWAPVHLGQVIGDILLLQQEAHRGKAIDFILNLDPSIPPLRGDEKLLTRLFLNLIKNAAEAIEREGRVVVASKVASELHLHTPGERPVPLITVEVRDNGRGIPPDEIEKIFTPFYTTKGRGSGLGLATCQKIVSDHNGFLKVESQPGEGTVVTVSLPFLR